MAKRILIVVNKSWEADPLVAVFQNEQALPPNLPKSAKPPKVTITLNDGATQTVDARLCLASHNAAGDVLATAEVWCIKNLMDLSSSKKAEESSSFEKARVLGEMTKLGPSADIVIAFGTAGFVDPRSHNGSVVVGTNVFVHNPHHSTPNSKSPWTDAGIGKLVDGSQQPINEAAFSALDRERASIEMRFISPPISPAAPPALIPAAAYVALSNVNITDRTEYVWADPEALRAFSAAEPKHSVGSVETTHGVIRLVMRSPQFLFVSGIANRMGAFGIETAPRPYAQNFAASHNAAVALAWMMPTLMA